MLYLYFYIPCLNLCKMLVNLSLGLQKVGRRIVKGGLMRKLTFAFFPSKTSNILQRDLVKALDTRQGERIRKNIYILTISLFENDAIKIVSFLYWLNKRKQRWILTEKLLQASLLYLPSFFWQEDSFLRWKLSKRVILQLFFFITIDYSLKVDALTYSTSTLQR